MANATLSLLLGVIVVHFFSFVFHSGYVHTATSPRFEALHSIRSVRIRASFLRPHINQKSIYSGRKSISRCDGLSASIGSIDESIHLLSLKTPSRNYAERLIESFLRSNKPINKRADIFDYQWKVILESSLHYKLYDYAVEVADEMLSRDLPFNSNLMTRLTEALCRTGRFDEALGVFDKGLAVNYGFSVHNFLPALKSSGSSKRARKILQRMISAGIEANVISFTAAVKSCEATGDWMSALEILDIMKAFGEMPNEITYCCLMSVAARGRAGEVAVNALREMVSNGVKPNQLCYATAMSACARSGMWDEVECLLDELASNFSLIEESVLGSVLIRCRHLDAKRVFSLEPLEIFPSIGIDSRGTSSSVSASVSASASVSTSVSASVSASSPASASAFPSSSAFSSASNSTYPLWQRAVHLLESRRHLVPNITDNLYRMTMHVLASHKRYDLIPSILQLQRRDGVPYTSSCYMFGMRSCLHLGDPDNALELLHDAEVNGQLSPFLYNSTLLLVDQAGLHEKAMSLLLQMVRSGNTTDTGIAEAANSTSDPGSLTKYSSRVDEWMPKPWLVVRVVSNALHALTRNFTSAFTEIVEGRLAPAQHAAPFVNDLTEVLESVVLVRNIRLHPDSYFMANKLLLDRGNYHNVRRLLNHTLYLDNVNVTRLYDFAVRSLTRVAPLGAGLPYAQLLIQDACNAGQYELANMLCQMSMKRIGGPLRALISGNTSSPSSYSSYSSNRQKGLIQSSHSASAIPAGPASRPFVALAQPFSSKGTPPLERTGRNVYTNKVKRDAVLASVRQSADLLNSFFTNCRAMIRKGDFPKQSYRLMAQVYKQLGMPELVMEVYKAALEDGVEDPQLVRLVVYVLARSDDYWDSALDIVASIEGTPDIFLLQNAIIACDTGRDWEQAIYLLKEIQRHGYNLTAVVVTSALSACAACGRVDEALQLLDLMLQQGIVPTVWTYNAAIAACSKKQRWRDALEIFELMRNFVANSQSSYSQSSYIPPLQSAISSERGSRPYSPSATQPHSQDAVTIDQQQVREGVEQFQVRQRYEGRRGQEEGEEEGEGEEESFFTALKHTPGASSSVTFNTLIEVLGRSGQHFLVDEVYAEAVAAGVLRPFLDVGRGYVDLHHHSVHMAEAAVRRLMQEMLLAADAHNITAAPPLTRQVYSYISKLSGVYNPGGKMAEVNESKVTASVSNAVAPGGDVEKPDLVLIVGKGRKLQDALVRFLVEDFNPPLRAQAAKKNRGRLLVPAEDVQIWIETYSRKPRQHPRP